MLQVDRQDAPGPVRLGNHLIGGSHIGRHGLFHQDVAARAQTIDNDTRVGGMRRNDDRGVRFRFGQHRVIVLEERAADLGGAPLARLHAEVAYGNDIGVFCDLGAAMGGKDAGGHADNYVAQ